MKAKFKFVVVVVMVIVAGSCRKLLHVPSPQNELSTSTVFSNDANAEEAMTGMYIAVMSGQISPPRTLLNGGMSLYPALSGDELMNTGPNLYVDSFRTNLLTPENIYTTGLYSSAYNIIFMANSLIAGLKASDGVSADVKSELRGEAEVVRALEYFYLVNLYGGVPLVTDINFRETAALARDSVAGVYAQIESDLKDAKLVLGTAYLTTAAFPGARTRPNKLTATALLARVELYRGEWSDAEGDASIVIGSGMYMLEPGLDSVFRSDSREAIWQLQPVNSTLETSEAAMFIPRPGGRPAYALTNWWLDSVEPGDQRRVHWVDSATVFGRTYYYPDKYKLTAFSPVDKEYNMVIRLAEVLLIRAEALAQQGNIPAAKADLDTVRSRAGLGPTTGVVDLPGMLAAIQHERQVELMAEWGHRWLDLRRWGLADAIFSSEKPGWKGTDTLYPIPAEELAANPKLMQNQGY